MTAIDGAVPPGIRLGIVRSISYGLFGKPDTFVPQLRELGATLVRVYFFWSQVEPEPGHYTFDAVDAFLDQLDGSEEVWVAACSSSWSRISRMSAPRSRSPRPRERRRPTRGGSPPAAALPGRTRRWPAGGGRPPPRGRPPVPGGRAGRRRTGGGSGTTPARRPAAPGTGWPAPAPPGSPDCHRRRAMRCRRRLAGRRTAGRTAGSSTPVASRKCRVGAGWRSSTSAVR